MWSTRGSRAAFRDSAAGIVSQFKQQQQKKNGAGLTYRNIVLVMVDGLEGRGGQPDGSLVRDQLLALYLVLRCA
jgi:hypothetical protein